MLNFDSMTIEDLETFIAKYEQDMHALAIELFPNKDFAFVTTTHHLYDYAKNKLQAMIHRQDGRIDTALDFEEKCNKCYEQLQDYARW